MAECICDYADCLERTYLNYKEAIGSSPKDERSIREILTKVNTVCNLWFIADACSDTTSKTLQCARLANEFAGESCLSGSGTAGSTLIPATGTFESTDLDASYVLTITHSLNSELVTGVTIIDPDDKLDIVSFTIVDADTVTVDFGGAIGSGTFTWIVTVQAIV